MAACCVWQNPGILALFKSPQKSLISPSSGELFALLLQFFCILCVNCFTVVFLSRKLCIDGFFIIQFCYGKVYWCSFFFLLFFNPWGSQSRVTVASLRERKKNTHVGWLDTRPGEERDHGTLSCSPKKTHTLWVITNRSWLLTTLRREGGVYIYI